MNGDGNGNSGNGGVDFTAELNTMYSHTDLIVKKDNSTNSVVTIVFDSRQNISAAEITSVKTKEGETIDVGLTTADIKYNLATKELELGANGETAKTIATKLQNSGDKSTISLSIRLTSNTANLNNTTVTVDVDINLIKATELDYTKIHNDIFKKIGIGGQIIFNEYAVFSFSESSGASYNNDKVFIKNSGNATDDTKITPTDFVSKLEGGSYLGKESDIYSSATITYDSISGTKATFFIVFTFQPNYKTSITETKFTLEVDIANNGKGSWDTTTGTTTK